MELNDKNQNTVSGGFAVEKSDRNVSQPSRLNPQGDIGAPRIWQRQAGAKH